MLFLCSLAQNPRFYLAKTPNIGEEFRLKLFKSGDKDDPGNYRPILILAGLFYTCLSSNQLTNPYQSGFRSTFCTLPPLLESTSNWGVNIDKGLRNGVVFMDLRKAFETIGYDTLLFKPTNVLMNWH